MIIPIPIWIAIVVVLSFFGYLILELTLIDSMKNHNTLYRCNECNSYFREYQENCKCGKYKRYKVFEYYKWMDNLPDSPKHNVFDYFKYKKLKSLIEKEAFERRSQEAFMKEWKKIGEDK